MCAPLMHVGLAHPAQPLAPIKRAQKGIQKLIRVLEGEPEEQFNAEQYMSLYT